MLKQKMIDYYMDVAVRTAELSYAKRLKVGAILVKNDSIIGHSWNGTPRGWDNECEYPLYSGGNYSKNSDVKGSFIDEKGNEWIFDSKNRDYYRLTTKDCVTHAEEALIMKIASSSQSSEGGILFCTHACCMNCARLVYGAKIKTVYYLNEYKSTEGIDFLRLCGIEVIKYNKEVKL